MNPYHKNFLLIPQIFLFQESCRKYEHMFEFFIPEKLSVVNFQCYKSADRCTYAPV